MEQEHLSDELVAEQLRNVIRTLRDALSCVERERDDCRQALRRYEEILAAHRLQPPPENSSQR